jgi:hypothetical protein
MCQSQTEYEAEVEQAAEEVQEVTGFSSPLNEHLVFVGQYISWYTNREGKPDKQDIKSFNEDLTDLIDETANEGTDLGDIALALWAHLNNIEQLHRKEDEGERGGAKSENRTADRMFQ